MGRTSIWLDKSTRTKIETLMKITGRSMTSIIKEAIDLLYNKVMEEISRSRA